MKLFYGRIKALTYFASGQLGFESKLPESFPIKPPAPQTALVAETRNSSKVTQLPHSPAHIHLSQLARRPPLLFCLLRRNSLAFVCFPISQPHYRSANCFQFAQMLLKCIAFNCATGHKWDASAGHKTQPQSLSPHIGIHTHSIQPHPHQFCSGSPAAQTRRDVYAVLATVTMSAFKAQLV